MLKVNRIRDTLTCEGVSTGEYLGLILCEIKSLNRFERVFIFRLEGFVTFKHGVARVCRQGIGAEQMKEHRLV